MFCKYCGSSIPDNSAFCPECGKKFEVKNDIEEELKKIDQEFKRMNRRKAFLLQDPDGEFYA